MKWKQWFVWVLALCLTLSLCACGGEAASKSEAGMAVNGAMGADLAESLGDMEVSSESFSDSNPALPENEKIITTMHIDAETEDMDPLLQAVQEKIAALGGYLENQEIYNGNSSSVRCYRYAYLTVRLPADQLASFVTHVEDNANIISENTSTENVTLTYVATESRINALQTAETRLLELLAQAQTMDDLLQIEARLTEVRAELEMVQSTMRALENKINYSTVYLNISEVKEYTVTTEPETVWERISTGFVQNLKNVGDGIVNIFVFLVAALPYLVPLGAIAAAVILLLRKKKKKAKKTADPPAEEK